MRPVSQQFLDAVIASHSVAFNVDILRDRQTIIEGVPLTPGGSVTLDRTRAIRGSCTCTIGGPGYVPTSAFDPLTPFGNEIRIWRGVKLSTGPELVSLGIFGIGDINVDDLGGSIAVTGMDRAQQVTEADFESTYVVPAGVNYATAIHDLIDAGVPGLTYQFDGTDAVTPLLVFSDDSTGSRWAAAQQMAASIGCDLYFDGDGVCILTAVPDPLGDTDIDLHDGPGGVVVGAPKEWDRAPANNRVIAYSSNPAPGVTPPRAVATDDDPTSPTYYFGPFGRKPLHLASEFLTSNAQALTMATAQLRKTLGIAQTLGLSVVPNPALEPGDVASVRRVSLGIDEVDVVDNVVIPLDFSTAMTAGVRARQVTQ